MHEGGTCQYNTRIRNTPEGIPGFIQAWRAPSERIRTASEIPVEVTLTDEDAVPAYMKISEKVLHLRRLGMAYTSIAERLGINIWMAKKAAHWAKTDRKGGEIFFGDNGNKPRASATT